MISGGHDDGDDDDKASVSFCLNSSNRAVQNHKHTHNSNYTPLSSLCVCLCLFVHLSPHFTSIIPPRWRYHFYLIYTCLPPYCWPVCLLCWVISNDETGCVLYYMYIVVLIYLNFLLFNFVFPAPIHEFTMIIGTLSVLCGPDPGPSWGVFRLNLKGNVTACKGKVGRCKFRFILGGRNWGKDASVNWNILLILKLYDYTACTYRCKRETLEENKTKN